MARLRSELQRLYFPHPADAPITNAGDKTGDTHGLIGSLVDAKGMLRAMVLQIGDPANWESTSAVWRGVQRDLGLPAPAIAVSGLDGFQLWFSLAEAVPASQGQAVLKALQARFLAELAPRHVRLMPGADASPQSLARSLAHQAMVPALQTTGNWSAFVSADLAPIFVETPWLDIPPTDEGQADLLRSIRSIKRAEWEAALELLGLLAPAATDGTQEPHERTRPGDASATAPGDQSAHATSSDPAQQARQFLLKVMNDGSVALSLRIEAAKALLQGVQSRDTGPGD